MTWTPATARRPAAYRAARGPLLALRLASLLGTGLLAACASSPVPVPAVDQAAVAHYRDSGYARQPPLAVQTRRVSALLTESPWSVSVTRAPGPEVRPLVIFLPSLGEDDSAPVRWVQSWAQAGYAVLVIQPLADDADVWSTPDARSGDFDRVARSRFAADLMPDRIAQLARLLGEIRARSLRAEPGLEALDWSRLALAGADLGAYTTQCIVDGQAVARPELRWPLQPKAYVIISPFSRRHGAPADAPAHAAAPASPHAPVLMISARDDTDAYGLVADVAVRHRAFDQLGPGPAWYLELAAVSHRWLAGELLPTAGAEAPHRAGGPNLAQSPDAPPDRRRSDSRRAAKGVAARDAMAPETDEEEAPVDKKALLAARTEMALARSRALTRAALSVASFEAVSMAFLDATVRDQPGARAWLDDAAGKWLRDGDRLKYR